MKKSYYFSELAFSYDAEIQDLLTDSEGSPALKTRLKEKRQELQSLLPMIEFCPEMVVPVFYNAFSFANTKAMAAAVNCEPDDDDFPTWDALSASLTLEAWAAPYLAAVLSEGAGESFMVTAACLEYIRQFDTAAPVATAEEDESGREKGDDEDGDDEDRDLGEAGNDWLAEQGFDSRNS
ncbi:hypothetical protein [Dechloromonas hortensis]|uniref:hypothetical protein n=1 Tax=Dechloromonas hortensis TaxID=337779 RepID=UPI0012929956|nr:hypothetical protein [Dechloromonas hortensis]